MVFKKRNSTKKNPQRGRVCGQREFNVYMIYMYARNFIIFYVFYSYNLVIDFDDGSNTFTGSSQPTADMGVLS